METPTCSICKKSLVGKASIDLWALGTTFDEEGEVIKTSLQLDTDKFPTDYVVIGDECCGLLARTIWTSMIHMLTELGGKT